MITYGQFAIEDVLPYTGLELKEYRVGGKIFLVKMNSRRYHVFSKSLSCVSCGITGKFFLLQSHQNQRIKHREYSKAYRAHFNLYACNGDDLVLMTKDHIIPKALGGPNSLLNYQTMCARCNKIKSNTPPEHGVIVEILNKLIESISPEIIEKP